MKITKKKLESAVKKSTSFRQVAKIVGISHACVKDKCVRLNVDTSHFTHGQSSKYDIGKTIYGLTILSVQQNGRRCYVECKCECGKTCVKRRDGITSGRVRYCSAKCTRIKNNTLMFGSRNSAFKGIGKVGSCFYRNIIRGAKRRNLTFDIDIEYISMLFDKQKGRCALSGLPISFGPIRSSATTASLDRIDSSKGYVDGNVQWVHKLVNRMKMDISQETFMNICCAVADNIRKEK